MITFTIYNNYFPALALLLKYSMRISEFLEPTTKAQIYNETKTGFMVRNQSYSQIIRFF